MTNQCVDEITTDDERHTLHADAIHAMSLVFDDRFHDFWNAVHPMLASWRQASTVPTRSLPSLNQEVVSMNQETGLSPTPDDPRDASPGVSPDYRAAGVVLTIAGVFALGAFSLLALDLLSNVPIELLEWPTFLWNLGLPILFGIGQVLVGRNLRRGDTSDETGQLAMWLSLGVVLSHVVFVWQQATSLNIPLTEYWQEFGHVLLSGTAVFLLIQADKREGDAATAEERAEGGLRVKLESERLKARTMADIPKAPGHAATEARKDPSLPRKGGWGRAALAGLAATAIWVVLYYVLGLSEEEARGLGLVVLVGIGVAVWLGYRGKI